MKDTLDTIASLHEFDVIVLTGTASSPHHRFTDLHATVATVSRPENIPHDDPGGYLKVWPEDGQPDPDGTGKIWFPWEQIESVRIVKRGDE
jgi:hypothetical protein